MESLVRWYCICSSWCRILLRCVKRPRIRLACVPRASRSCLPCSALAHDAQAGRVPLLMVLDAILMVGLVAAARNTCTTADHQQVAGTPGRGDAQHTRRACQRDTPATASRRSEASLSTGFSCAVHRAAAVRVLIRVTPLRTTLQLWRGWRPGRASALDINQPAQQQDKTKDTLPSARRPHLDASSGKARHVNAHPSAAGSTSSTIAAIQLRRMVQFMLCSSWSRIFLSSFSFSLYVVSLLTHTVRGHWWQFNPHWAPV